MISNIIEKIGLVNTLQHENWEELIATCYGEHFNAVNFLKLGLIQEINVDEEEVI